MIPRAAARVVVAVSAALATSFWGVAAPAAGATPSARLVYERRAGAEECPDAAALRAAVITRLGYDPFDADASSTLFAEISREASTYRASVKLVDDAGVVRGARELEHTGPRCADLVDGMGLTISIAIDPRSLAGPAPTQPAPAPPAPAPPAPSPAPPAQPAPAPPAPAPLAPAPAHLFTTLIPTIAFGSAAAPAVGLIGSLGLLARPFSVAIEARGELPSSRDLPQGTVSTSLLAATLAPCWLRSIFTVCALGTAGRVVASARGITSPRDDSAVHVLGGARVGAAEPLTSALDLRATADVLYAFTPQSLRVDGQEIYALSRVSVVLGLGLGLHFL